MDIFVQNVPANATNKHLAGFFKRPLNACGIHVFHVEKFRDQPMAIITVLDVEAGELFLGLYGIPHKAPRHFKAQRHLHWASQIIRCMKSRNEPSEFSLRALQDETVQQTRQLLTDATSQNPSKIRKAGRFDIKNLACGVWEYENKARRTHTGTSSSELVFVPHFQDARQGTVSFGRKQVIIFLGMAGADQCRIDINYHDCIDITLGSSQDPSISLNLNFPPKMYEAKNVDLLLSAMEFLSLAGSPMRPQPPKKTRLRAINDTHAKAVGSCFVYRIALSSMHHFGTIKKLMQANVGMCPIVSMETRIHNPQYPLDFEFNMLNREFLDTAKFGGKPFDMLYQVELLAKNGRLSPRTVLALLPKFAELHSTYGLQPTLNAIRGFHRKIPPAGPQTQAHDFSVSALEEILDDLAASYDASSPDNPYVLAERHAHINLIHKVVVTPSALFLTGPEPEPTNRVLRRYADYPDHFIRVVFSDEDGAPVRYDARTDSRQIYNERFKSVLDRGISIGGRLYSFLGFSHSSLRSQSSWFMTPLLRGMHLAFAEHVLKELGDFSHIRSPAKCAARIGQSFTDTNATVELKPEQVGELPVVTRNGRDFSDGVGTISTDLLRDVLRVYGSRRLLKPTALQIRFQGAKGMLSLDTRLRGKRLMLRSNMRKFETKVSWNLEICGAGFRPLPMIFNRQFVKIFEDLGVPLKSFMDLQTQALDQLRKMTKTSISAAAFLKGIEGMGASRIPELIRCLGQIGYDYHHDNFLYSVVEMGVITKVRDIKYRGRIPIKDGVTLYGIMDETGYLREHEIFVVTEKPPEGGRDILVRNNVVVTRSPAMHPGDIQVVNAVDVPSDSPLKRLNNVVVFSQYGERDLPSMLSGGDLDGDLYNVIYDKRLMPQRTYVAADYPRVSATELDRAVNRKDMSDFFVRFMESDQLGMLCNMHMQLADQRPGGTLDPDCIKLAAMASTAVDFSKTGISVDLKQAPKVDRERPDFMAPSPRVVVLDEGRLGFEDDEVEDDEAFEGLDSERRPFRYYTSHKALGHLFRAVDERKFLTKMHSEHTAHLTSRKDDLPAALLAYMKRQATQYSVMYDHHLELAANIRMSYEESLIGIVYDFEPSPHMPLSEVEVFAGSILGRQGGAQGKPLRELSKTMRERFETVLEYARMRMIKGDEMMDSAEHLDDLYDTYDDREFEALPRAIACLEVAVTQPVFRDLKLGELKSFRYVAAEVCLRELERFRITTFGSRGLPPI